MPNNNENKIPVLTRQNYVSLAEEAIKSMGHTKQKDEFGYDKYNFDGFTTTKLRNILSLVVDIYHDVTRKEELTQEEENKLHYLKMRCVYEAGREKQVKKFMEKSHVIEYIEKILEEKEEEKEKFITFFHYMESLVAYRKFYAQDK